MGSLYHFRKVPHGRCYGVEVECYPILHVQIDDDDKKNYIGFFYMTMDASLRMSGREFVSQPLPYDMLVKQLGRLWKTLHGWTTDNQCGLHIHVSRAAWSDKREYEFSLLLRKMTPRQMEDCFGRWSERFANPRRSRNEKFRAINLCHKASYEFRVWKAGDLEWTLEALRRTKEIVEYRGKWTYDVLAKICGAEVRLPIPARTPDNNEPGMVPTDSAGWDEYARAMQARRRRIMPFPSNLQRGPVSGQPLHLTATATAQMRIQTDGVERFRINSSDLSEQSLEHMSREISEAVRDREVMLNYHVQAQTARPSLAVQRELESLRREIDQGLGREPLNGG